MIFSADVDEMVNFDAMNVGGQTGETDTPVAEPAADVQQVLKETVHNWFLLSKQLL